MARHRAGGGDDVADAGEEHHGQRQLTCGGGEGALFHFLRQGQVNGGEIAVVHLGDGAGDKVGSAGDLQREVVGFEFGEVVAAAQPRAQTHGGVAAELAAHHLQSGGGSVGGLQKAHLLGVLLPAQQPGRRLGLQFPPHRRGDQQCDIFRRVDDRIAQHHGVDSFR